MLDHNQTLDLGLDYGADVRASDWFYMKKLIADVQRELASEKKHVILILTHWLVTYDMLRTYEDEVIMNGSPTVAEVNYFRGSLALIKGHGIHILNLLEHLQEEPRDTTGVSCKDIAAIIHELDLAEDTYNEDTVPKKREEELLSIFGDRSKPS